MAHTLVRRVRTVSLSVTGRSDGGTVDMVSTAELLGRARVVDVGRGQNCAILLVVSNVAILVSVTNLVPFDAPGGVLAQVPSTEVSGAPSALVFPGRAVLFAIAQLGIFDAVQLVGSTHAFEFVLATVRFREGQHGFTELGLIFTVSTVPDAVTNGAENICVSNKH